MLAAAGVPSHYAIPEPLLPLIQPSWTLAYLLMAIRGQIEHLSTALKIAVHSCKEPLCNPATAVSPRYVTLKLPSLYVCNYNFLPVTLNLLAEAQTLILVLYVTPISIILSYVVALLSHNIPLQRAKTRTPVATWCRSVAVGLRSTRTW
jgi:hypothetical protein